MKIKRNIAVSDSGFVFNPLTGDSFSTNPVGAEIIRMMKEYKSDFEIKNYILENYQTDNVTFEKDYYDFVNMLVNYKLTELDEKI